MDGKQLTREFLDAVDRAETDLVELQPQGIFRALDVAACEFARQTRLITRMATITSVDGQNRYDLPPDFLAIFGGGDRARGGRLVGKYTDAAGGVTWPFAVNEALINQDEDAETEESPPKVFAVVPRQTAESRLSGSTTSAGAAAGGEAALNKTGESFTSTVEVRDRVHNLTTEADGIVIAVVSNILLTCAMFGGKSASFGSGDSYVIVPGATQQVLLGRKSNAAAETLKVPYIAAPPPVFSDYASWPFPEHTGRAIAGYAAYRWLTDKKKGEPRRQHYAAFAAEVVQTKREMALNILRGA